MKCANYPRATHCGGDIVTLLWLHVCVCPSLRPGVDLVKTIDFGGLRSKVKVTVDIYGNKFLNTIETKPLCVSS